MIERVLVGNRELRKSIAQMKRGWFPHGGLREQARRARQIERGVIKPAPEKSEAK